MGKSAERRGTRRSKFLARLAEQDPERFEQEWAKRIESWGNEIHRSAKDGKIAGTPVFRIAQKAGAVLSECGAKALALQGRETKDVLENECCRALARYTGGNIYNLNQGWKEQ